MSTEIVVSKALAPVAYPVAARNPAKVYLAKLAASSRRVVGHDLRAIAEIVEVEVDAVPWGAMRYEHTQAIRVRLLDKYSATSARRILSALRGVLKAAWRLGYMTADQYMAAVDLDAVKGESTEQAAGRSLSISEITALAAACNDGTPAGKRDAAMIALGYAAGLRRSEIVALDLKDVDTDTGTIKIQKGKGNKKRTVVVQNGALDALKGWLVVRGDIPGAFIYSGLKGGAVVPERMTDQAFYSICRSRAEQAKVKPFSPHDLRRTFAGEMLDAGVDIATVQKMMGHSDVKTTAGYDRRGERAKTDAAKRLYFPYQGA